MTVYSENPTPDLRAIPEVGIFGMSTLLSRFWQNSVRWPFVPKIPDRCFGKSPWQDFGMSALLSRFRQNSVRWLFVSKIPDRLLSKSHEQDFGDVNPLQTIPYSTWYVVLPGCVCDIGDMLPFLCQVPDEPSVHSAKEKSAIWSCLRYLRCIVQEPTKLKEGAFYLLFDVNGCLFCPFQAKKLCFWAKILLHGSAGWKKLSTSKLVKIKFSYKINCFQKIRKASLIFVRLRAIKTKFRLHKIWRSTLFLYRPKKGTEVAWSW